MDLNNTNIEHLLSRRLIDLEGRDFVALAKYAGANVATVMPLPPIQAIGIPALANALSCSPSQIANMRRDGALNNCIISHVGRNYVFDVEKAREAANHRKASKNQGNN